MILNLMCAFFSGYFVIHNVNASSIKSNHYLTIAANDLLKKKLVPLKGTIKKQAKIKHKSKTIAKDKVTASSQPSVKLLGNFGHWHAYTSQESGKKVCYMINYPVVLDEQDPKRQAYVMITHRPEEGIFDTFNSYLGYAVASNQKAVLTLKDLKQTQTFDLVIDHQAAWSADDKTDQAIVKILISWGHTLQITAQTDKKLPMIDQYQLKGATKAYRVINQACQVPNRPKVE